MKNTHKKNALHALKTHRLASTQTLVRKVSPEREKRLDEKLELQTISIRLQKNLINDLKALASEDGLGYQPYIRQVLTQHVRSKGRKRE